MPRDFKTILCATDFSDDSYRALDYGVSFAKISDGTSLLHHIFHGQRGELYERGPFQKADDAKRRALAMLEGVRKKHRGGYQRCELMVVVGDPYETLLDIPPRRKV